jgi:hypothetical protein
MPNMKSIANMSRVLFAIIPIVFLQLVPKRAKVGIEIAGEA